MQLKLEWMQCLQPQSWVIGIRYMQAMPVTDQPWLLENWLQRVAGLPLKRVAMVKPHDFYNEMEIESLLKAVPDGLLVEIQLFTDTESAMCWV